MIEASDEPVNEDTIPPTRGAFVSATIQNVGTGPAGAFSVRFQTGSRTLAQSVSGLGPGQSTTVGVFFEGSTFVNGTATVDPADAVNETNENNNTRDF